MTFGADLSLLRGLGRGLSRASFTCRTPSPALPRSTEGGRVGLLKGHAPLLPSRPFASFADHSRAATIAPLLEGETIDGEPGIESRPAGPRVRVDGREQGEGKVVRPAREKGRATVLPDGLLADLHDRALHLRPRPAPPPGRGRHCRFRRELRQPLQPCSLQETVQHPLPPPVRSDAEDGKGLRDVGGGGAVQLHQAGDGDRRPGREDRPLPGGGDAGGP